MAWPADRAREGSRYDAGRGGHRLRELAIQLRHLRYFVKIVDAGSFSRAAATIYVAQPALSAQIAELEEELGVVLLNRSARGVKPTVAGEALYREATQVLQQIERIPDIVRYTGGELAGAVSLGMSSTLASFLGGSFMKACKTALPLVRLNFVTDDSATLKAGVAAGELDLAVVFDEQIPAELVQKLLFRQRLFLVDTQPQPGNRRSISLDRIAGMDLVLPGPSNVTRMLLDARFAAEDIRPRIVVEANLLPGILAAVQSGMGATIIPMGDFSATLGRGVLHATLIEPPIEQVARVISSSSNALSRAGEAVRARLLSFVRSFIDEQQPPGMVPIDD